MREHLDQVLQEMKDYQLDAIATQISSTIEKHVRFPFFFLSYFLLLHIILSEKVRGEIN